MGIFTKGINKAAFQGKLTCPYALDENGNRNMLQGTKVCGGTSFRFVEEISPTRLRYRCRKCGGTIQYDISNNPMANPYAPFRKGKIWSDIMKITQGRNLKGVTQ